MAPLAEAALGERRGRPIPRLEAGYQTLGLLTRAEAEAAARLSGLAAMAEEPWDWTVAAHAVRHVMRQHGDPGREARRGQIAVTAADWSLLPRLILAARELRDGGRSDRGHATVLLEAALSGALYTLTFEVLAARRMLTLLTVWKRRVRPLNVQDGFAL